MVMRCAIFGACLQALHNYRHRARSVLYKILTHMRILMRALLMTRESLKCALPAWCRPPPKISPVRGVLSRAVTSELQHHDAGCPRYAQANAPHARGLLAAPVGTTRDSRYRIALDAPPLPCKPDGRLLPRQNTPL